ncbi:MAG: type II CAAX endopeptidase family protein [Cyclobacteriaceae bacterium]
MARDRFYRFGLQPGYGMGLLLLGLFTIVRFILVLQAMVSGSYGTVSFVFIVMAALPFILLTREGRRAIGIRKPSRWSGLLVGIVLGSGICLVLYLASLPFSSLTWFEYVSGTYAGLPDPMPDSERLVYFMIFSGVSMTFSPIGEELFYRGLVHENFRISWGERAASLTDSAAFALVHLAHFGIVYTAGEWSFLPLPSLVWVGLLFVACLLFNYSRRLSGSILGAILSHAAFNLAMNYVIFYRVID